MGIIILSVSIIAADAYVVSMLNKRVNLLNCCIVMIKSFSVDLAYCNETVLTITEKASKLSELKELSFLKQVSECTEGDFAVNWSEAVDKFLLKSTLSKKDADLLKSFGNKLGTTDCFHQTQLCDEYIKRFEEIYKHEKSKLAERIQICKIAGGAAVLTAFVLLI